MQRLSLVFVAVFLVSGCSVGVHSAGMLIVNRNTSEAGKGVIESKGQAVSFSIGKKICSGNYATVRDYSEIGLINAHGQSWGAGAPKTVFGSGTVQSSSTTGYAKGLLTCTDGDLLRCEVKHDGPSGYGVCFGKDGVIFDLITGTSL